MRRRVELQTYRAKTILNKHKRPDHWFWTSYTAYPYKGCQHRCLFCYCRERKYCPFDDVADFGYLIQVKENAPDLLRRALSRVPVGVVGTGDYQAAERKYGLSRRMLEVCLELGFPVLVLERSPLVLQDLDLLQAIDQRAVAAVMFSIISTPDSPNDARVREMECLAPPAKERFAAMEKLSAAGILTGTCMMPVLPKLCDDDANLEAVVRWTAEHGGRFVMAGDLTLSDQQRVFFFDVLKADFPDLAAHYKGLYPEGSYGPARSSWPRVALRVRELCEQHGISDRMPRPVIPGHKRALNMRVVEELANRLYYMELNREANHRVWAYRKAAWAIEELEQDIGLVYQHMGRKGLESIQNVGPRLAGVVEDLIHQMARKVNSE
jgi:DNA repair photolyase